MWVRVTGVDGDVFRGSLLNEPTELESLTRGEEILFMVPEGGEYPIRVTEKYLEERPRWRILAPCDKCGLSELFDPPSELLSVVFPGQESAIQKFTAFCGMCGGIQVVRLRQYGRDKWIP